MLKPAGADSVGALFRISGPVERSDPKRRPIFPGSCQASRAAYGRGCQRAGRSGSVFFSRIPFQSPHFRCGSSRDAGTLYGVRFLYRKCGPPHIGEPHFPRGPDHDDFKTRQQTVEECRRQQYLLTKASSGTLSGMEESWHLQLFGEDPSPVAPHFAQTVQRPPVEGSCDSDKVLLSDPLGQAKRQHSEMKLDETQQ